ncbi:stage V sporulation protein E [Candidatus Roizmanbacteria bacterium CG_4_10_14_0_8_um_filter_39_9]|uniref:Probable peptidoglycan glycosyltransferase FtsW n=1 Tax=Candidatus Roizmanbacteria bacterium CG_4_10_14_0_8_um_filter_39_9 TaxID=1974829 RepID=A0A2M7QC14_9BACT|nr:MAG: stage V sporulation protein E [Candidatus Roizmanbacteria bacterium CG_4_10_14_0_8_um_filter_39_9]
MRKTNSTASGSKHRRIFTTLFSLPITLAVIGLFFVFEASYVRSFSEHADSFHYFKIQALWIVLGILIMAIISYVDYHKLYYIAFFAMLINIFLLFLVLIPGVGSKVNGARRWIFGFQPSELAKLSAIVYLSSWFITKERKRFFSFLILLGLLMFLIILQPDMGTAIIIFCLSIVIYFLAGIDLHYLLLLIPGSALGFYILAKTSPYRLKRIVAFFDPSADPLGITYHINQILISLSNGGLFGQGFGSSKQKHLFLPEAHTDSIFAIIGEEIGFFGSVVFIALFIFLIIYIFRIAEKAPDRYGRLLAGGIFAFFGIQTLINIGSMVHIMPLTGVPLPFISYGGSNLLICFTLMGIVLNIARSTKIS